MMRFFSLFAVIVSAVFLYAGCEQPEETIGPRYSAVRKETMPRQSPSYRFAVHPLHNPAKLSRAYQPLIDYLNEVIPDAGFILEASRDYAAFEKKIQQAEIEFLLPNPWQTLQAMELGYEVIAMAGTPEDFRGIFITRKDGRFAKVTDLKGRTVSYPAPTALAACMMPQYFLFQHGIDIHRDIRNTYVGSQESSIMNVFLGESAAGVTWPPPWRLFQKDHPEKAKHLQVQWRTEPLLNNSVMAGKDIPNALKHSLRQALFQLTEAPSGKHVLTAMETAGFYAADDDKYDKVRAFIMQFERDVRPVQKK